MLSACGGGGGDAPAGPFGPESEVALIEFDAQGDALLTVDGRSFSGLSGITVTDANNYSIGSASLGGVPSYVAIEVVA